MILVVPAPLTIFHPLGKLHKYSSVFSTSSIQNSTLFNGGQIAVLGKLEDIAKGFAGTAVMEFMVLETTALSPQLLLTKTFISPEVPEALTSILLVFSPEMITQPEGNDHS